MNVRPYRESDQNAVRLICHATADAKIFKKSKKLVCALYCDYYIENEPDFCFVITDEFDKPVGYILCSSDDKKFSSGIKPYLKRARKISLFAPLAISVEHRLTAKERELYPAHLHIDLLPAFRKKGGGRTLINALKGKLRGAGVKGLRLTVSASNAGAIAFYERLGFERLRKLPSSYVYGVRI